MRVWLIIVVVVLGLSGVGVLLLRSYNHRHAFNAATRTYATLQDAMEAGVIKQGWLPDFLPRSARDIREKHNYEENRVIACFSFDPSEKMLRMLSEAIEVADDRIEGMRPPAAIGEEEPWFRREITQGEFRALTRAGFRFYSMERNETLGPHQVIATWYFAVNQKAGLAYLWLLAKG